MFTDSSASNKIVCEPEETLSLLSLNVGESVCLTSGNSLNNASNHESLRTCSVIYI